MEEQVLDKLQDDLETLDKQVSQEGLPTPKILIGVPILAWTHEFAISFLRFWTDLMTYQHKGRKFHVGYEFKYRRPVHIAEEELAQNAIDSGCTHLLLMDDDIFDVKVEDFLALLDADKDVVGGIMHTNGFPYSMCAFRKFDRDKKVADQPHLKSTTRLYEVPEDQRKGIQPVDLMPFAFTLIKTSVFDKIPKPWFKCDAMVPTDSWFADSIHDKNLEYYAHFDVWLNHNGTTRHNVHLKKQIGFLDAQRKNPDRVIGLTPEEMNRHEAYMVQKMEEAEEKFKIERASKIRFLEKSKENVIAVPVVGEKKETEVKSIQLTPSVQLVVPEGGAENA